MFNNSFWKFHESTVWKRERISNANKKKVINPQQLAEDRSFEGVVRKITWWFLYEEKLHLTDRVIARTRELEWGKWK